VTVAPPTMAAVVVAAGRSRRFGRDKLFMSLGGWPVLTWSLRVFEASSVVSSIVLVLGEDRLADGRNLLEQYRWRKLQDVCVGGRRRQDSVWNGVQRVAEDVEWVAVHDGARPFITVELIERGFGVAREIGAAVAAVPIKDTVKVVERGQLIERTPPRATLWAAQTPQITRRQHLIDAYISNDGADATDDAEILERAGRPVAVFESSYENLKITTREDLAVARHLARARQRASARSA
jgi:2-C-methyl-D-erythritol 4-phosphate cytidylyltransferase